MLQPRSPLPLNRRRPELKEPRPAYYYFFFAAFLTFFTAFFTAFLTFFLAAIAFTSFF